MTWVTTGGRAGVAPITLAHKRLFPPKRPATGVLHIAGQRGGQEFAFRLSDPRYGAARETVSYRASRLTKRAVAATAAAAAPRRFGAASLSVIPHASLGSGSRDGGNNCLAGFVNDTWYGMAYVSSAKWDTDIWTFDPRLKDGFVAGNTNITFAAHGGTFLQFDGTDWESDGGLWRGCANHTTWKLITDPEDPVTSGAPPANVTIDFNLEWDWTQLPSFTCTTSDPRFICPLDSKTQRWHVRDSQRPPA